MTERLALVRSLGNDFLVASEAANLSMVERQLGNLDVAEELDREALVVGGRIGDEFTKPFAIAGLAAIATDRGDNERAATLLGAAETMMESQHMEWPPDERPHYERMLADLPDSHGRCRIRARAIGREVDVPADAVALALTDARGPMTERRTPQRAPCLGSLARSWRSLCQRCASTGNQASPSRNPAVEPCPIAGAVIVFAPDAAGHARRRRHLPGTYTPRFEPTITFTVGDAVNLDCAPNYECRGEVAVDEPGWVALDFGHDHGSELSISRVEELADGTAPPADFAAWLAALPASP